MFMLNGVPLAVDTAFTSNGIQYPANWLRLASPEAKAAIGITEIADPTAVDTRYYYSAGNPRPLEEVKAMRIKEIKQQAFSLLQPTDWRVLKAVTNPPTEPAYSELLAARDLIRTNSNTAEAAINACTDVDAVAAVVVVLVEEEE